MCIFPPEREAAGNADRLTFDPSPLGWQTLVSSVILADGWWSQPWLLPQFGLLYICSTQPPPPRDFSSRSPESESRVMRYIFQDPQNDLLQPPFLTSPFPLISAQFFLSLTPPPHWIDCPPPTLAFAPAAPLVYSSLLPFPH